MDAIDAPKMVSFPNGNLVEELSLPSPPTISSPAARVRRSGSVGSYSRRYRHPTQQPMPSGMDAFSDVGVPAMERPISPRSASAFIGGPAHVPCAAIAGPAIPMNNEQYPCDCCRIEDQQYLRDFTPTGTMLRRSEVRISYFRI